MTKEVFNPMELDALGEMMNISLGSSATAVSNMLEHRVNITTPKVSVVNVKDFEIGNLEPAMGVQIKYVEGLDGSNIMLLRRNDVKVIVDILLGSETPDEEFELNELTISAVCEVMNQMMGSAATAMSDFLGFPVNISTPETFALDDLDRFKAEQFPKGAERVVVVRFNLKIEDALESEFMNVISVELAKELLSGLGLESNETSDEIPMLQENTSTGDRKLTQAEIEAMLAGNAASEAAPAGDHKMSQEEIERMMSGMSAEPEPAPAGDHKMSQEEIERMMAGMNSQPEPAPAPSTDRKMSQEEIEKMMAGSQPAPQQPLQQPVPPAPQQPAPQMPPMPQGQPMPPMGQMPPMPPYGYPPMQGQDGNMYYGYYPYYPPYPYAPEPKPEPKVVATQPLQMDEMPLSTVLSQEQSKNLDLIMGVPLQVTVEIGRTRRKVQDILEFSKGSLVVLDKLAGEQVDLFVNGKCIAKGDVVVVDDNFGVRITEIVQKNGMDTILSRK